MIRGRLVSARRHVHAIAASFGGLLFSFVLGWETNPRWDWMHSDSLPSTEAARAADWARAHTVAHGFVIATTIALLLTAIVPLVLLLRRERVRMLSLEEKATGFSVAADGPGFSVAIGNGRATSLVEVDSLDDARQIATAVKARFPAQGNLELTLPRQSPFLAVGMMSFVALSFAVFMPLFEGFRHGIEVLGMMAVLLSPMLAALVIVRSRQPMKLQWGTAGTNELPRALDRSPLERHVRRHIEARIVTDPAPPRVRVDLLARGADSVSAWLARLDAMPRSAGYRGETAPRELLFETVNDPNAAIDVRLSAARLLRVRDGEERTRISEAITDDEVRARVDAVTLDDQAEAEAALSAVGPMFRTRG